ncbi:MAG: Bax inhibitor-1 family protein, partial [Woeseiaceae bacterium]|nr:Bax inhibitor-1 family protein [Woeseiaceae bacterium]
MQDNMNYATPVADASVETRSQFIWKVYAHVVGGIFAFAAIEAYLFSSGLAYQIAYALSSVNWLLVLGGLMLSSWGATHLASRVESTTAHYIGYAILVFAQAIIFTLPLAIAMQTNPGIIDSAAGVTILGCVGLIATAMITRKDFSFLR